MSRKRVVVLCNGFLLMGVVLRLLQRVEDFELECVAVDDPEAFAKIGQFRPQVVVLDAGGPPTGRELMAQVLCELPRTKVIALNLDCTDIDVYHTRRVSAASVSHLLDAIRGRRKRPPGSVAERRKEDVARSDGDTYGVAHHHSVGGEVGHDPE